MRHRANPRFWRCYGQLEDRRHPSLHFKRIGRYQTFPGLKSLAKLKKATVQFAICIHTNDPDLLTPRRIYQVLPDESADRSNYIRVIDNEGEDYLYPAKYFISGCAG